MYQRKLPIQYDCSLRLTLSLINSKWKPCILDVLRERTMRPNELYRILGEVTPRVLNVQLKEMVEDGLLSKRVFDNEVRPHTEYSITDLGRSLLPIIDSMIKWGEENRELLEKKYDIDPVKIRDVGD